MLIILYNNMQRYNFFSSNAIVFHKKIVTLSPKIVKGIYNEKISVFCFILLFLVLCMEH